jgi:hypothetical protein
MINFIEYISEPTYHFHLDLDVQQVDKVLNELNSNNLSPISFKWYCSLANLKANGESGKRFVISECDLNESFSVFDDIKFPIMNSILMEIKSSIDIKKRERKNEPN